MRLLVELVVIQQVVKLHQDGIRLASQFRYPGKDIFRGIVVDEHGRTYGCLSRWESDAFYHPRVSRLPMIPGLMPAISQRQLKLRACLTNRL